MGARPVQNLTMPSYRVRFFFDWGSGCCLWAANDQTRDRFGYPIHHHDLELPDGLAHELDRLEAWRNTALNWDYPPDPGPWREPECEAFNAAVTAAFGALAEALGRDWELVYENEEMHEDPELDRYLADPRGFER